MLSMLATSRGIAANPKALPPIFATFLRALAVLPNLPVPS